MYNNVNIYIFFLGKLLIFIIIVIIGSFKVMERDMVVNMVIKMVEKGVNIIKVVVDEDRIIFFYLRIIYNNIMKISDRNYIRKIFFLNL